MQFWFTLTFYGLASSLPVNTNTRGDNNIFSKATEKISKLFKTPSNPLPQSPTRIATDKPVSQLLASIEHGLVTVPVQLRHPNNAERIDNLLKNIKNKQSAQGKLLEEFKLQSTSPSRKEEIVTELTNLRFQLKVARADLEYEKRTANLVHEPIQISRRKTV